MVTKETNGYVTGALLMHKTIKEMRDHVEFEKFLCRMLVDNDDTRAMKENTDMHPDKVHKFIYNNDRIDEHTMRGKYAKLGQDVYQPTESGDEDGE